MKEIRSMAHADLQPYFNRDGYILGNPEMSAEVIERFISTRP